MYIYFVLRISSAVKFSCGKEIFKFQINNFINNFKYLDKVTSVSSIL